MGLIVLGAIGSGSLLLVLILASQSSQRSEGEVHKLERLIDVVHDDLMSKVHLGHGLGKTNDAKKSSGSDIHVGLVTVVFSLELSLFDVLGHDVLVKVVRNGWLVFLSVSNEGTHDICIDGLVCSLLTAWSNAVLVD